MSTTAAAAESETLTSAVENGMAEATISSLSEKSALRDNIERKGNNAYYFAHAKPAQGPQWDGKAEPRLLSRESSSLLGERKNLAAFEYHKSNITSYAFLDEGPKVKIYVNLAGAKKDKVSLDYTSVSLCLVVADYVAPAVSPEDSEGKEEESVAGVERCLSFGKLFGSIESASFKVKKERIILTLNKVPKETLDEDDEDDDEDEDDDLDENDEEGKDKAMDAKDDKKEDTKAPTEEEEPKKEEETEESTRKEPKLKYVTWTQITSQG